MPDAFDLVSDVSTNQSFLKFLHLLFLARDDLVDDDYTALKLEKLSRRPSIKSALSAWPSKKANLPTFINGAGLAPFAAFVTGLNEETTTTLMHAFRNRRAVNPPIIPVDILREIRGIRAPLLLHAPVKQEGSRWKAPSPPPKAQPRNEPRPHEIKRPVNLLAGPVVNIRLNPASSLFLNFNNLRELDSFDPAAAGPLLVTWLAAGIDLAKAKAQDSLEINRRLFPVLLKRAVDSRLRERRGRVRNRNPRITEDDLLPIAREVARDIAFAAANSDATMRAVRAATQPLTNTLWSLPKTLLESADQELMAADQCLYSSAPPALYKSIMESISMHSAGRDYAGAEERDTIRPVIDRLLAPYARLETMSVSEAAPPAPPIPTLLDVERIRQAWAGATRAEVNAHATQLLQLAPNWGKLSGVEITAELQRMKDSLDGMMRSVSAPRETLRAYLPTAFGGGSSDLDRAAFLAALRDVKERIASTIMAQYMMVIAEAVLGELGASTTLPDPIVHILGLLRPLSRELYGNRSLDSPVSRVLMYNLALQVSEIKGSAAIKARISRCITRTLNVREARSDARSALELAGKPVVSIPVLEQLREDEKLVRAGRKDSDILRAIQS